MAQYETVIGLEVHVELATKQKFSAAAPPHLEVLQTAIHVLSALDFQVRFLY